MTTAYLPSLRRSIDPRLLQDGRVLLLRGADDHDIELEGAEGLVPALLRLLDGTRSLEAIGLELRVQGFEVGDATVAEAVDQLASEGIVDDQALVAGRLDEDAQTRFARQLSCFADMIGHGRHAIDWQLRIQEATVCLLGLGGLGSWVAWALASAGVGRIVGVDGDRVELSNLNRQILYTEADVGHGKAEAAGRTLRAFNSRLSYEDIDRTVRGVQDVREIVRGADLVIDSLDTPGHRITQWVDEGCQREGIPHLAMSQHPPKLRIGPLFVPGLTACFACQEADYRAEYPLYDALAGSEQLLAPSATFGPACGVVGSLVANEALTWLGGQLSPASLGTALIVDLRDLRVEREPLTDRRCERCRDTTRSRAGRG